MPRSSSISRSRMRSQRSRSRVGYSSATSSVSTPKCSRSIRASATTASTLRGRQVRRQSFCCEQNEQASVQPRAQLVIASREPGLVR